MSRGRIRNVAFIVIILFVAALTFVYFLPGNRLKRLTKKGNDLLLEQEYEMAVEAYTRALQIDSTNASAYFARGDAYAGLGETQKARLDYIRAEELNTDMAGAVERKLSEMNALDREAAGNDSDPEGNGSNPPDSENDAAVQENPTVENAGPDVIPPEDVSGNAGTEVIFNQEAMAAAADAGSPEEFPSQQEMILADADVYNTFQSSSHSYRTETSGPLTVYYDSDDGHIACILAPAGTYADHDNAFEHALNAQYYYRLRDDGNVEPAFIYLSDEAHTEVHMIYMWEKRVIRYVGPVDSPDYLQDYSPALTVQEFAGQVPQGVFAANACLELRWMEGR